MCCDLKINVLMYLYCFYFATEIGQFTDLIER